MTQQELKTLLQDYVATANDPNVAGNWNKIDNLFPELANVDKGFLKDYVATANDPKVSGNWDKINSLFPETGIKPEDPKTKIFTDIKEIDLKRDDKGGEGNFYDKFFYSEKNAVTNLRKHYDTDNNDIVIEEGVAPDSIWGNWLPEMKDNVYIKNEAGEERVFKLPSMWNAPMGMQVRDWGGTIKEINDFINEGRKNKDPNYISEKKGLSLDVVDLLDNKDFLTEAMGTDAENWKYIAANDDDDKKELTKKIKEKFGDEWGFWFDPKDEYSTLNEYDIEKAIDKAVDAKLHVYNNQVEAVKIAARKQVLDVEKTSLFQFGRDREEATVKNFSEKEKEAYFAFDALKKLLDDEDADPVALQQAHMNLVEKRKNLGTVWSKEKMLVDENGNTISDITQVEGGGFSFDGEELSAQERMLSSTFKGSGNYLESLNHASNINYLDLEVNQQDGETYHDIVINDASAHVALLKLGYTAKGRTKNGFKFNVKKKHLGGSYNHLVKGDGFDFYHDLFNHKFGSLIGTTLVDFSGNEFTVDKFSDPSRVHAAIQTLHDKENFESRDGHFGLLEFDDKQTFKGKFWDQNEYEKDNNDLSKAFKRSLKDWQEDSRRLSKDRVLLNKMFLLNSDPGSNEKTWDLSGVGLGATKAPTFIKKHVLDPVHRGGELLGEGFSHAGGFDIDPFMSSKRSVNDAVEAMSYNTGLGLTDDQKDRMHRSAPYKVLEGVAGFVPAIVEFALIDVGLHKVGAITGIPKLINKLTKVHTINKKALSGAELTKLATQYSKASGKTIKVGDDAFTKMFMATKGANITKAAHSSRQMMMYHTAHALKEEGKMKIAFEDDYKLGMGTGFYLAGRFLPRWQSAQYNRLNTALRVGRSGVAGMLGVQAASQLEAVIEDLRGSTTFRKHIVDNYSNLSEAGQSAITDFFVFSIVGGRSAIGKWQKGVGFASLRGHETLRTLRKEANDTLDTLYDKLKKDPKNEDLLHEIEKYKDLRGAVSRQLTDLYRDANLQDPEKAEEYLQMIMEGNMKAFSGENKIKYKAVVDVDPKTNIGKTKEGKEVNLDGDPAKFNREENTMYFDTAQLTPGKAPHEIGHALYWNLVKSDPKFAEWLKDTINDSFGDAYFEIEVKHKESGKTIRKDVGIEEYIKHAYGKEKNFDAIKAEEYVMHALELLSRNNIYAKVVGKGTWNSLKNDMNKFSEQYGGFTLWKAGDTKGQVLNFLGNIARSAKGGKLTEKQANMFKALAKKEGFYIEGIEADSRTSAQKNKEKVIKDVDKSVKSKKNKLASARIQERYENEIANLTGAEADEAIRKWIQELDPKNPKTSVAGKTWDSIIYGVIKDSPYNIKDPVDQYTLASELVYHLNRGPNAKGRGLPDIIKAYKKRKPFFETVKDPETGGKSERFTIFDKFGDKRIDPKKVKELEEEWGFEAGTQEFISKAIGEGYKGKQNLTKTVMQTLALRIHKMKEEGIDKQSDAEYEIGFRRDLDDFEDLIESKEIPADVLYDFKQVKKTTAAKKITTITLDGKKFKINPETTYTREGVNIREILDINEAGVNSIKEINRENLLKAKPEDATFGKLGDKALKETTRVLKEWFGRTEGVAKKDYYELQRERVEDYNDRLYTSITLTSHPKFYENSMVGHTIFKKYFKEKIDKNGNKEYFLFTEMPTNMTPKERAAGPTKWEKEKLENLPEKDLANLIYSGRKDTHEKKVNELIAKIAKPFSQGILREQLNNPEFQRQLKEKNRELYEHLKVQNAIEQLRGATPSIVASKKFKLTDEYNTVDKALRREVRVLDEFMKEYIKLDFEKSLNIEKDIQDLIDSRKDWVNFISPYQAGLIKALGHKLTGDMLEMFRKVAKSQRELGTLVGQALTPIIFKGKFKADGTQKAINTEVQKHFLEQFKRDDIDWEKDLSESDQFFFESIDKGFQAKLNSEKMVDYYFNKFIPELLKDMPSILVRDTVLKSSLFFTGKYKIDPKVAKKLGIELTKRGYVSAKFANKIIKKNPGVETKIIDSKGKEIKLSDVKSVDNGKFKLYLMGGVTTRRVKDKKTGKMIQEEVVIEGEFNKKEWKNRLTDEGVKQKLTDHIVNTYLKAKGAKTYEDTISANERLQEYIFTKMFNHYSKSENKLETINGILLLLQAQTNIGGGFVRSLATHTGVSLKLEDINRSEHPFQVLHFSGNAIVNMLKNSGSEKEFLKNYRPLARIFKQTIIPESLRKRVDGVDNGGNIGNVMENLKDATDIMSEANFIHDIATLSTILNLRTGKTYDGFLSGIVGGAKGLKFLQQARKNLFKNIEPITGAASKKSNIIELTRETHVIEKAKRLGRMAKKEKKGMSTWDFDDTLAKTKSGVGYRLPNPRYKPGTGNWYDFASQRKFFTESNTKKKVIFMAGPPGSGKSNVIKQLKLKDIGMKVVAADVSLEKLIKKADLPADMKSYTPEQTKRFEELTMEASVKAGEAERGYQREGAGVVVDGTGARRKGLEWQVKNFQRMGYDVGMVFVEASEGVATARNKARKERSLSKSVVANTRKQVMGNKEAYRKLFGKNFAEVKTDNLKQGEKMPNSLTDVLHKFIAKDSKGRLSASEYADRYTRLKKEGAKFDFSEFDRVVQGEKGPLFGKAMDRAKKFGTKDQFILTARPHAAKESIHEFLKSQGLNIPLKNIITLENSSAEAKAMWMLEKFSEGYNDMYFADDALPNVKAVKKVLDQLDVKSNVQQAMASKKNKLSGEFRKIIEESRSIPIGKTFSAAAAKEAGKGYKFFVAPSVMDMRQLIKPMLAKGELGMKQEKWFRDNFLTPYGRAINDFNIAKNQTTQDYHALLKVFPKVRKMLKDKIPGSFITYENAVRLHRWKEAGFDMTEYGLSKAELKKAIETVEKDPQLLGFSRGLGVVSKQAEGYIKPTDNWIMENISTDLFVVTDKINLKKYLADWIERKNEIFSEKSLNMLEHELGTNYREALEDVLWRMEHNSNRNFGSSKHAHTLRNINNATVAGVMFFNIRSATLQLISTVNYLNFGDNNIFKAGARLIDLPQFTKDFAEIWNSDMMIQRRGGLRFDIAQQEIMEAIRFSPNKATAALRWMLEKGYIPTKYADNFAIAFGGASYLRNRINTYKKTMSEADAKKKAWEDFVEITQERQQSSRPDFISQQQAGVVGSLILNWGNTPMQMFRIQHKSISDLGAGRFDSWTKGENSAAAKVSQIMYYGAIQSAIFYSLQTALLAVLDSPDEDMVKEKEIRTLNGMLDSYLLGWGMSGKAVSTLKNTVMEYVRQNEKDYNANHTYTLLQALNFSPPVSVKARKLYSATQTMKLNKDEIAEKGFSLDNPAIDAAGKIVSVATNVPLDRVITKLNNVQAALNNDLDNWQRIWLMLGWNKYNLGINDPNINRNKKKKSSKKVPYATY